MIYAHRSSTIEGATLEYAGIQVECACDIKRTKYLNKGRKSLDCGESKPFKAPSERALIVKVFGNSSYAEVLLSRT